MKRATAKKSPAGLLKFLVLIILLSALLIFLVPRAVQSHIKDRLAKSLGLSLAVGQIDFSFTSPQFLLKDLLLSNPEGFPASQMAEIRRVNVQYAPSLAFLKGLDIQKVQINFKELRLVRNEAGEINLPVQTPLQAAGDVIDEVVLNLGPVTYTDLSGKEPVQKSFDVGLSHAVYRNVKGIAGIMEIVNWEVLKRTGVQEEKKEVKQETSPAPAEVQAEAPAPQAAPSEMPTPAPTPEAPAEQESPEAAASS